MRELQVLVFFAIALVCSGCTPNVRRYILEHSTVMHSGIRETPVTDYWYYKLDQNGIKSLLWHQQKNERYAQHWISDSGTVWVQSEPFPGPGGDGSLWVANPDQFELGKLYSSEFVPRSSTSFGGFGKVSANGNAETLRKGTAEMITLDFGNNKTTKVILYILSQGSKPTLYYFFPGLQGAPSDATIFERVLRDPEFKLPEPQKSLANEWLILTASKKNGSESVSWLASAPAIQNRTFDLQGTRYLEHKFEAAPTTLVRTPSGYLCAFVFDTLTKPGSATFELIDGFKSVHTTDLLSSGQFRDASEAKESVLTENLMWKNAWTGWMQIPHSDGNSYARDLEKIEFYDKKSHRYELDISAVNYQFSHAEMNVTGGLQAKRPLEDSDDPSEIVWQRDATSENGIFHVKLVKRAFSKLNPAWDQDPVFVYLYARTTENGKVIEVPVWSSQTYNDAQAVVSNSGRVFVLTLGKTNTGGSSAQDPRKVIDSADIKIWGLGTNNMGGIGLLESKDSKIGTGFYRSNDEVRANVHFDKMRVESRGVKTMQGVQGMSLPTYSIEEFWIPQSNGADIHQAIVDGKFVPWQTVNGKAILCIPDKPVPGH